MIAVIGFRHFQRPITTPSYSSEGGQNLQTILIVFLFVFFYNVIKKNH